MSVFQFMAHHEHEVLTLTSEHLWLVGMSMALAIAIGVPSGIVLTRRLLDLRTGCEQNAGGTWLLQCERRTQ